MRTSVFGLVLVALLFAVCCQAKPRSVIIDTDLDIDDIGAIIYLVKNPNVIVKGITVSGNGFSDPIFGVPNLIYVLNQLGCGTYPVAYGEAVTGTMLNPASPAQGNPVPGFIRTGIDLYFSKCLNKSIPFDDQSTALDAVSLIISTLETSTEPVDILLLGSSTNVAKAFVTDPSVKKKVGTLYFSGGYFDLKEQPIEVNPNKTFPYTSKTKGSSWNYFLDPLAAERLFMSGLPIYIFTSQAQYDLVFDSTTADAVKKQYNVDPFIIDILYKFAFCTNQPDSAISWWDESAAVWMVELQQGVTDTICTQWENITHAYINLVDGSAFGRTFFTSKPGTGTNVYTCKHSTLDKFLPKYFPTLGQPTICPAPATVPPPLTADDVQAQVLQAVEVIKTLNTQIKELKDSVSKLQGGAASSNVNLNFGGLLAN
eukprot:TRINITY_DN1954_c0_g1_i1.p1 TRINITY_DN1954_c0_g1~~TRINITY_DN1954_c0_g1_i1.p1  ORF type:complete len:445 (-),score=142.11 TRINITY_DN1954_c0_g1_i1:200-1480(-)